MNYIVTKARMREIESLAAEQYGIPGRILMENAGRMATEAIMQVISVGSCVVILCGCGNNGGDGFVVARHLFNHGYMPRVFLLGTVAQLSEDANWNYQILARMGISLVQISHLQQLKQSLNQCHEASGLVDALLGTGLHRPVSGLYLEAIQYVQMVFKHKPIFALDIPSGLAADSGEVLGGVLQATHTLAMGGFKPGHLFNAGALSCGHCQSIDVGIPRQLYAAEATLLTKTKLAEIQQRVTVNDHKGCFGKVAIWAGSQEMPGAALLNARAALKTGSGVVELFLDTHTHPLLAGKVPEIIYRRYDYETLNVQRWASSDVLLLGSGLGQSEMAKRLLQQVLEQLSIPLVIDADGINMLRPYLDLIKHKPIILTPHLGEMARLIQKPIAYLKQHTFEVAQQFVQDYGVCLVLKSANTVIASPKAITVYRGQNVNLATAGSGDVLSGCMAAFVAQGYSLFEAACLGVWVHGQSVQDLPPERKVGFVAGDIIERLNLNLV